MSPEQYAHRIIALMASTDPADEGTVPAAMVHVAIRYAIEHHSELAGLGDYGLRRLADALVLELGTPPSGRP